MLIDDLMPTCDAARVEHRIVAGDVTVVYAATRRADFMLAWRGSAAVRLMFAARGLAERAVSLIARRPHREPPPPAAMRLAEMPSHGDWVLLGEDPPPRSRSAPSGASGPGRPSGGRSTPRTSRRSTSPAWARSRAASRCVPTAPAAPS